MTRSRGASRLHGYLVIDKPAFWTSHDVVGRVRRLTGERKVGHAGTLDPAATGVLPVAIGMATRSLEFLAESSKTYLAEITLGIETDSYDADGAVVSARGVPFIAEDALEQTLATFRGSQAQIPPMHSAIKIDGRRLYDLARRGETVERAPRPIELHEIALIAWQSPVLTLCVDCSKGTYVRSLARDIGERLGCGGYLSNLVRVRTGPFALADAWTLAELEAIDLVEEWERVAVHPDAGVESLDAVLVDDTAATAWRQGKRLPSPAATSGAAVRVYDDAGDWLGVGMGTGEDSWQPHKVISDAA